MAAAERVQNSSRARQASKGEVGRTTPLAPRQPIVMKRAPEPPAPIGSGRGGSLPDALLSSPVKREERKEAVRPRPLFCEPVSASHFQFWSWF